MQTIPAINETSFSEVAKKMKAAATFGTDWIHLDVADGKFTGNTLWNNPADLSGAKGQLSHISVEVHLMMENPDDVFEDWIDAGAKRVIVHLESVKDIEMMIEKCELLDAELFLAISPDTAVEKLFEYENRSDGFLILAVTPGKAGQEFRDGQLEKIRILRRRFPDATLEVDGGVNYATAKKIKDAGADILVSASAIWGSENPKNAYLGLLNI